MCDDDDWDDDCGLMDDGQCALAGTEHCDFSCPMRSSEFFVGSEAWHRKNTRRTEPPNAPPNDPHADYEFKWLNYYDR